MGFRDECGVMAIVGNSHAANLAYLGLYALQHRGQESAGIACHDGTVLRRHRSMGYVADVFGREAIDDLPGSSAIGHVRYSTAGSSVLANAQPLTANTARGCLAVAHNGNIVNGARMRAELEAEGAIFQSSADSEILLHLIARSKAADLDGAILESLDRLIGAWSLVLMVDDRTFVVRDAGGFRPLVLGRLDGAWVAASESCALDLVEAELVREVAPGEVLELVAGTEPRILRSGSSEKTSCCSFEHIYFARPDSMIFGESVAAVRERLGAELAREHAVEADVVVPVPDSGIFAALGYSRAAGIPYDMGLVRNHYVGRTFIEPKQSIRHFGVKVKLNPVSGIVRDRRVILVDDSLVRGTTSRKIAAMLYRAGAAEVHLRISSPPTRFSCYYGIDTPERLELVANRMSVDEIRQMVGVETLGYLSQAGLERALQGLGYCFACFSGNYPVLAEGGADVLAKEER